MFTASSVLVQLPLNLLVCDRSVSVNVITHTFVGLKCLTETKIQILCDHVSHTCLHTVEMGCQMVQLLSAHNFGPTMCVNLTLALVSFGGTSIFHSNLSTSSLAISLEVPDVNFM